MKIVGLMPVRNEEWCLGLTLRAALMWCDEVVIVAHACTDRSWEIVVEVGKENPERLWWSVKPDVMWTEMLHRQLMLEKARECGATHIALIDADEILTANLLATIRAMVEVTPGGSILQVAWLQLRSLDRVHNSGVWGSAWASLAFRDAPYWHWSAQGTDQYDFHHRHPMGAPLQQYRPVGHRRAGLMHLQFLSERRLHAKQYLYQLTERLRWPGRKMADYAGSVYAHRNARTAESVSPEWLAAYEPWIQYLDIEAEPWQIAECKKIVLEHPGIEKGLDDFGLKL